MHLEELTIPRALGESVLNGIEEGTWGFCG
jgi:hypothetical protein